MSEGNFVKVTKDIFQSTRLPEERMELQKKSVAATNSRKNYKKNYKKKNGRELICKKFGVNGKIVKEFLRFSLSRQGPWEENNTKNHKEWPKKSPMATDSDWSATNCD